MLPRTIEWVGPLEGHVKIIDQTLLPGRLELLQISDMETMFEAIRSLRVFTYQILIPFVPPEAMSVPSGEKTTA